MNSVTLIGRLVRKPEMRQTNSQMSVAGFTLAVDRPVKAGEEKKADFPRVVVFGRQAESCAKYLDKGSLVAVNGRLQTGSYEKNGEKVFTTDVVANRVEFLSHSEKKEEKETQEEFGGFAALDEEVPF